MWAASATDYGAQGGSGFRVLFTPTLLLPLPPSDLLAMQAASLCSPFKRESLLPISPPPCASYALLITWRRVIHEIKSSQAAFSLLPMKWDQWATNSQCC